MLLLSAEAETTETETIHTFILRLTEIETETTETTDTTETTETTETETTETVTETETLRRLTLLHYPVTPDRFIICSRSRST